MSAGRLMAAEMAEQPAVLASLLDRRRELLARVRAVVPDRPVGSSWPGRSRSSGAPTPTRRQGCAR